MTESMIDRLAAQIAYEICEQYTPAQQGKFPDDFNGDTIDRARSRAKSILEALNVPTRAMIDAAYDAQSIVPEESWPAMIEAALSEKGE